MNTMTPLQEENLAYIKAMTDVRLDRKYRAGQAQHGGNLFDKTPLELIEEAINEAIDQLTYLITARKKLLNLKEKYADPIDGPLIGENILKPLPDFKDEK